MIRNSFRHKVVYSIACSLAVLFSLGGCSRHDYKSEADERVYRIIDQKWQDEFGSKVNYRVSDVAPSPNDVKIERAVPACGILTIPQAVAIATAHNRQYQTEKESLYISALDLRFVRHDFETRFFGGPGVAYAKDRNDQAVEFGAEFGFEQLLANGAWISTRVSAAWLDILSGNLRGGLTSVLSATIIQPLLRGSTAKIAQENLTQAERNTLYQLRVFNRFRKIFIVSIISQYYQILQQFDAAENAGSNYDTLAQLYELTEKLVEGGRLQRIELDRVRQEKLQARDTRIETQKVYEQMLDEFKVVLGLPANSVFRLDDKELEALKEAPMMMPGFSETEAVDTALLRRLDLANSTDGVADAERKVMVAADGLRGDLNLVASAAAASDRAADVITLKAIGEEYALGLDWDIPFDRVAEQNIYRKALITLAQSWRSYEQTVDTVTLEIRQAYRDLQESSQRYRLQAEGVMLARERFDKTSLLLQYGRASSRRVLQAQQDLLDAQNAAAAAMVNYTIATLNFYRDAGVLAVRPDGMWELPSP